MEIPMQVDAALGEGVELPPLATYREPLRTWASHGTGAMCTGCGTRIQPHEIEYEIETQPGRVTPSLHFHFACYRDWTGRGVR